MEFVSSWCQLIVPLRSPDARFAQSKEESVRSQVYAPTLRCRCGATRRHQLKCECKCKSGVSFFEFNGLRLVGGEMFAFFSTKFEEI